MVPSFRVNWFRSHWLLSCPVVPQFFAQDSVTPDDFTYVQAEEDSYYFADESETPLKSWSKPQFEQLKTFIKAPGNVHLSGAPVSEQFKRLWTSETLEGQRCITNGVIMSVQDLASGLNVSKEVPSHLKVHHVRQLFCCSFFGNPHPVFHSLHHLARLNGHCGWTRTPSPRFGRTSSSTNGTKSLTTWRA